MGIFVVKKSVVNTLCPLWSSGLRMLQHKIGDCDELFRAEVVGSDFRVDTKLIKNLRPVYFPKLVGCKLAAAFEHLAAVLQKCTCYATQHFDAFNLLLLFPGRGHKTQKRN